MTKPQKKEADIPKMPFDEAIKRLLNTPPNHKKTAKKPVKKEKR